MPWSEAEVSARVYVSRDQARTVLQDLARHGLIVISAEGLNRSAFLFVERPNEGSPAIYVVRLLAFLLILAAIAFKNGRRAK